MIVTRIRWAPYRIPFKAPYETARGKVTSRFGVIVQLITEDGIEGLGEGTLDPSAPEETTDVVGRSHPGGYVLELREISAIGFMHRIAAISREMLGKDLGKLFEIYGRFGSGNTAGPAHYAIDTAVQEILAKSKGLALANHLFPARAEHVDVNTLVAARTAQAAAKAARQAVANGYNSVKLKVGMEESQAKERARVAIIREAIGPETRLRLDANAAWNESEAIELIRDLEPFNIEMIEQPVLPGDFAEFRRKARRTVPLDISTLRRVREAVQIKIAADESITSRTVRMIIETGAVDVVVLKPARLLRLPRSLEIAQEAGDSNIGVVVTTNIESGIGTAACLHLAAAVGGDYAHGLATLDLLEDDLILDPGLPIVNGRMRVPSRPGLGVTLDEEALMRYSDGWHEVSL